MSHAEAVLIIQFSLWHIIYIDLRKPFMPICLDVCVCVCVCMYVYVNVIYVYMSACFLFSFFLSESCGQDNVRVKYSWVFFRKFKYVLRARIMCTDHLMVKD